MSKADYPYRHPRAGGNSVYSWILGSSPRMTLAIFWKGC